MTGYPVDGYFSVLSVDCLSCCVNGCDEVDVVKDMVLLEALDGPYI